MRLTAPWLSGIVLVAACEQETPYDPVQCFTDRWSAKYPRERCEQNITRICEILIEREFTDVDPVRNVAEKEIVIYVGRASKPEALDATLARLKSLKIEGKRPFEDAFLVKLNPANH